MTYSWMSYRQASKYEGQAKELGVSKVARSSRGFMRVYERVGSSRSMKTRLVSGKNQTWGQRRDAFIKRHIVQYNKNPTRRRWLALIMWAFKPDKMPME